jgi:hypothetical protein
MQAKPPLLFGPESISVRALGYPDRNTDQNADGKGRNRNGDRWRREATVALTVTKGAERSSYACIARQVCGSLPTIEIPAHNGPSRLLRVGLTHALIAAFCSCRHESEHCLHHPHGPPKCLPGKVYRNFLQPINLLSGNNQHSEKGRYMRDLSADERTAR